MTHSQLLEHDLISGESVTKILDLGQHAYADTFVKPTQLHMSEPVFPLEVYLNSNSGQVQVGYVSNADDRYNLYGYSYTSSNSEFARTHWDQYATQLKEKYPAHKLVIEIGSNDGYLLNQFGGAGVQTLGIDSSKDMCDIATAQGMRCINAVFTGEVGTQVRKDIGHGADLIIANNVFNHANDPVDFARGVKEMLSESGVFVFELPYWADTVDSGRFDQIYHEHISYFTVKSALNLLAQAGLRIIHVDHVDYHGGSIRVTAQKGPTDSILDHVQQLITKETQNGLFDPNTYVIMQHGMQARRDRWLQDFYKMRRFESSKIIGVGAAAKANTWLNWHRLDHTLIHCITDSSPHKQGKFTPLSRIPILGDEEFAKYENPYALILSWNIGASLKKALLNINPTTRFITQ